MNTSKKIVLAAAIALTASLSGFSQMGPVANHPAMNLDLSKLTPELRSLITQLVAQSGELRGLAATLRDQMMGKTTEERKAIIDKFRADHATMIDAQRTLAKQIRTEMKDLRAKRKVG